MVGILFLLLSLYPLCWMVVLHCSLRWNTNMFLLLLSEVVFQLTSVLYQGFWRTFFLLFANIWFWLNCLLLFTCLLILWAFAWIFILRYPVTVCSSWFVVILYLLLIRCFFLEIFWVSPFCAMSVNIDSSALMLLIWFSSLVFHFSCGCLLLFVFRIFGILPIISDITFAVTYFIMLMLLRLSTSSAITSWIA